MFAALLQLHSQAVDVAGRKSETPGLSPLLGAPLPTLCARVAVGRVAPHCAVVFNSCLTTRLGADVRTPGTRHEAHRRVTVLEDSARTAVGVLSSAARWQSGHLLRAPGRGSAFLRRPRFVLMRRTGHFLVGFEGRPTFVQHSRAVDVADRKSGRDLSASWRSLAVVVPPARLRCTLAARWAG